MWCVIPDLKNDCMRDSESNQNRRPFGRVPGRLGLEPEDPSSHPSSATFRSSLTSVFPQPHLRAS